MATLMLVPLVPAAASGGTPIASDPAVVTRLTLEAQSSSRVWPLRLTGRLTDGAFNGLSGETVAFETSADGTDWEATATAVTDESGSISIVTWLARTMLFRATYAGETGIYLPSASDVTTAGYIPNLSWVTTPPASVAVNRTFAVAATVDVPEHACVGKLKCERLRPGTYVVLERKNVAIQGRWNAKDGRFEYVGSASLPTAGDWRVSFELPRDSTHELVGVTPVPVSAGCAAQCVLSASKTTSAVGSAVVFIGHLRSATTGRGIGHLYVCLEKSVGQSDTWSKVGSSVKTGADGKVRIVVHPQASYSYRLSYGGGTTWKPSTSPVRRVQTTFTLSGRAAGDFLTKKVWIRKGGPKQIMVRIDGRRQSVWISASLTHSTAGKLLASGPGTSYPRDAWDYSLWPSAYFHFRVVGNGYFKITVWN